ncbi:MULTISPECIES: hypothetical protein [unclassified Mesorhizobium]|uniref:hypothetical protein n=1 Tax=unclassified Mesorhizobium TaxID=325217 RepID=UPI00112EBBD2|nr:MULTISPECIES: hypothetical protein [unclassified Mesorhizobium]MBZ9894351.1 hypothetical protein [Mesorhizobium sp. BR1-1-6]TPM57690.1 hypothetical protein FJ959_13030 [Mesorhizobium sp. B2-2-4]TPM65507.1 hypothetical protein FJ965_14805 [Mesorhizobium sp. B2-2-1]TPM98482.1 hypothetical protein FJ966_10455 [Mesorhizobium sp. B2-1-5]TPN38583.1 hypothetical protein FJ979_14815 [Mesorhizobium sp. B1-1-6]
MASPVFKIELESDVEFGEMVSLMGCYSDEEYRSLVQQRCSDSHRREVLFRNIAFVDDVTNAFAPLNAKVEHEIADVESIVKRNRKANKLFNEIDRLGGSRGFDDPFEETFKFRAEQHLSGPEFADLAKIIISSGALGAGGAAVLKATKDIVIKWLDNRGKKKVKISLGSGKSIEIVGPISDRKVSKMLGFLQEGLDDMPEPARPKLAGDPDPPTKRRGKAPRSI